MKAILIIAVIALVSCTRVIYYPLIMTEYVEVPVQCDREHVQYFGDEGFWELPSMPRGDWDGWRFDGTIDTLGGMYLWTDSVLTITPNGGNITWDTVTHSFGDFKLSNR